MPCAPRQEIVGYRPLRLPAVLLQSQCQIQKHVCSVSPFLLLAVPLAFSMPHLPLSLLSLAALSGCSPFSTSCQHISSLVVHRFSAHC